MREVGSGKWEFGSGKAEIGPPSLFELRRACLPKRQHRQVKRRTTSPRASSHKGSLPGSVRDGLARTNEVKTGLPGRAEATTGRKAEVHH